MENQSVEHILKHLIDGKDPKTGRSIQEDSPLLEQKVKDALNSALETIKNYQAEQIRKLNLPANTGKPWTNEDEQKLTFDFDSGLTIGQLAKNFKRTKGAIRARLIKLGKIEDDYRPC